MTPTPTAPEVADLISRLLAKRMLPKGAVRYEDDPDCRKAAFALRSLQAERDRLIERVAEMLAALKRIRDGKEVQDPRNPESTIVIELPLDEIETICVDAITKAEAHPHA